MWEWVSGWRMRGCDNECDDKNLVYEEIDARNDWKKRE